jgi:hypothetical protein
MARTASQLFEFINQRETFCRHRHEVASTEFGALRRSIRSIIHRFSDGGGDDALDCARTLWRQLSKWLTAPVPFDIELLRAVTLLGLPDAVEARWGRDIRVLHESAVRAAQDLQQSENPVRTELRALIFEARHRGSSFRIHCPRSDVPQFESLMDQARDAPLGSSAFLHTLRDYRETAPFDDLILVGPLRAHRRGAPPDAFVAAPRFSSLAQIVWCGCADEEDFGYDPVANFARMTELAGDGAERRLPSRGIAWTSTSEQSGEDLGAGQACDVGLDEFLLFRDVNRSRDGRAATLVHLCGGRGILYAPLSLVLSFDPTDGSERALAVRSPRDNLFEGMFVVRDVLDDPDYGGVHADHGHYSRIWRERLNDERARDPRGLSSRLRAGGLDLVHLDAAVAMWCSPPDSVIHAPQQREHFEVLIRVLGLGHDEPVAGGRPTVPWWQRAWVEVSRTRGTAIQAGVVGHEILQEQKMTFLNTRLPEIRLQAARSDEFRVSSEPDSGLDGEFLFHRALSIEGYFVAPDGELERVHELDSVEQWRA